MENFLTKLFKRQKATVEAGSVLPEHIAIIMDGNRRWADAKKLPKVAGYKIGLETLKEIYRCCLDLGIKYLTVYAFSTENNNRPKDEVNYLKWLFIEAINKEISDIAKENVKVRILGRTEDLDEAILERIKHAETATKDNNKLSLQVMYNYGGRAEIVDAANKLVKKFRDRPENIDEDTFAAELYMAGIPDPDLLIRTGGDLRVSNFLLWEIAYTEIYATDVLFPDFKKDEFMKAINDFSKRTRRFGS